MAQPWAPAALPQCALDARALLDRLVERGQDDA